MNRYDSYKDSGVEWIGEIPSHWKLLSNKYFTQSQKNKSETGEEELLSVSEYQGVIPRKNIREGEEHLTRSESLEGYLKVRTGDLVSNIMLMWKRGLGVSEFEGIVSPSYSVFSFQNSYPKYFHYLFRTDQYVSEFRRNSTGVIESRLRLYDDKFGSIKSHFPPLSEQQQIVSFLDTKTSLIDTLIEKTQRKIELLKEKRTSLINEVVTKGLNPNVEMKDSGVEWIGEIPSHWWVSKLGFLSKPIQGIQVDVENQLYNQHEGSERFIRISDYTMEEEPRYVDSYPESSIVNEEDLVMVRYGSKSGKVYSGIKGVICNNVFRIEHNEKLYTKFLSYFLNQESFYNQIEMSRDNNTLPQVSHGLYKEMKITIPVIQEQHQIVSYLDEQTKLIDNTISIEEKRMELLKEYRQSLISEVVTGKRKVVE